MDVLQAIDKLDSQFPLRARRAALPPALAAMHRTILHSFIARGRPPSAAELAPAAPDGDVVAALKRLSDDDLVVLDLDGREIAGAYPMSAVPTPHSIRAGSHNFYAMCALDALSIAPMFALQVRIDSRCQLTGTPISLVQDATTIVSAVPGRDVRVGIHWQNPRGAAAHSLCLEIIFLRDAPAAAQWQMMDAADVTVFALDEAVTFGASFFKALL